MTFCYLSLWRGTTPTYHGSEAAAIDRLLLGDLLDEGEVGGVQGHEVIKLFFSLRH